MNRRRPFLEQENDGIERRLGSSVRPQRHDEVVQAVAGVVGRDDDRPVRPVVVLRSLELTVLARLHRYNQSRSEYKHSLTFRVLANRVALL